ncbi:hypothetical protein B0T26DRAFT_755477 [Lasiosphaeria miniovina]|uniref:Uncharacterized protein n=1 Tax=Lasiosphaeria miniovina TaxID=1954250 RepID=A0AA39ZYD5_9PEZI|nr:uncharacterized protein B0T26DRAFT_755477 [Lasiosphaeria miniovina]KAK0705908.1 hypothetical protein B0T26DRAFT_755477 [Lasiosphaeria miniovina]
MPSWTGILSSKPNYTVIRGPMYTQPTANFIRKMKKLQAVNLDDHEEDPCEEPSFGGGPRGR